MTARTKRDPAKKTEWSFVRLWIGGKHLDPQKVSKKLGISPDLGSKRGELVAPNSQRRCKAGSWGLESGQLNWGMETQMRAILRRITPVKERLRRFLREDATIERAYLTVAFEPPKDRPGVSYLVPAELVSEFVSLGLDIVHSIYFSNHAPETRESTAKSATIAARRGGKNR